MADTLTGTAMESRTYQRGDTLFKEDTHAKGVFYIESGTILLTSTQETGTEVVIRVISSNNFIGFLSVIQKTKSNSTAIALQDNCRVRFISKALFLAALEDNRFVQGFTKILCALIMSHEKEALQFKTKNVSARLAMVLVALNDAYKKSAMDAFPIIDLKKKYLASLIGAAPETTSRQLAELEKEGFIELHIKGIKLKDKVQLQTLSDANI